MRINTQDSDDVLFDALKDSYDRWISYVAQLRASNLQHLQINGFILSIVMIALGSIDFNSTGSLFLFLTAISIIISTIIFAFVTRAKKASEVFITLDKNIFNKDIEKDKEEILNRLSEEFQNAIKSNESLYNSKVRQAEYAKWFFTAGVILLFFSFVVQIVDISLFEW